MIKKVRGLLKNNKGFTLVELLAVIVILGIIAAIAVPSIGGIIDNTKSDAQVANAQQMIAAARLAYAGGETLETGVNLATGASSVDEQGYSLATLLDKGYLESFTDPDNSEHTSTGYVILVDSTGASLDEPMVFLNGDQRDIGTAASPKAQSDLNRDNVSR